MTKVCFWRIGDTIVNVNTPSQTFLVINILQRIGGDWVTLQNVHTKEKLSGYELGMQKLGLVGYREDKTIAFV